MRLQLAISTATASLWLAGLSGCLLPTYNLSVSIDKSVSTQLRTVVDIIGVNQDDRKYLSSRTYEDYWSDAGAAPTSIHRMVLERRPDGRSRPARLSKNDSIWREWGRIDALIIVARYPVAGARNENGKLLSDPRCLSLPIAPKQWRGKTLRVVLMETGVVCTTPPRDR